MLSRSKIACRAVRVAKQLISVRCAHGVPAYASGISQEPLSGLTIGAAFDLTASRFGDRLAVSAPHQQKEWSYSQLAAEVDALATALLGLGLRPGERVGILCLNSVEWITAQYAAAKARLILVCINPAYKTTELAYALNKVGIAALLSMTSYKSSHYEAMLLNIMPELGEPSIHKAPRLHSKAVPSLRHVIFIGGTGHSGGGAVIDYHALVHAGRADIAGKASMHIASTHESFDAVTNIQYTSGTTGLPKAASLSHHNILNNALIVCNNMGITEQDGICLNPPLFHCFGCVLGSLVAIQRGAAILLPNYSFDPIAALELSAAKGATAMYGVPTMFLQMLAQPSLHELRPRLSRLRTGIMAGSICPVELMRRVESDLGIKELTICYGMTETSPISFETSPHDPEWARTETVGRVAPHTEVKIVDPATGRIVPRGAGPQSRGELCARGYCVMRGGYWGDEAKTAEAIKDGWMHSGDLAEMDEAGYVRIVGRLKDMIIRGGENVYPREIEDFLFTHPEIANVSVFGVTDEIMGEEVAAYCKLKPNSSTSEEHIRKFCHGKIAHYKIPRYVRFVEHFPLTASGKIQKFIMRAEFEAHLKASKHAK